MKKITSIILATLIAMAAATFVACKVPCSGCYATGECSNCDGTGKETDKNGNIIGTCPACKGSGECPMCEGKQTVKKSDNNYAKYKEAYHTTSK